MKTVAMMNSRMQLKTNNMQMSIQMSKKEGHHGHVLSDLLRILTMYSGPYDLLTALNIAVRVRI